MTSWPWRRLFREAWHPSFEEIMLYLDGEAAAQTEKIDRHLKSCWSCRARREKVDRVISAFMDSRQASFGASAGLPPHALSSFEAKLDKLDCESGPAPFLSSLSSLQLQRPFAFWRPLRLGTLVMALAFSLSVFIRLSSVSPVSAKEILGRAKQAEAQRILGVAAPVIYQKLQLRRSSSTRHTETISWEVWTDTENKRFRQRVKDEQGLRFLSTNREALRTNIAPEANAAALARQPRSAQGDATVPPALAELEQVFRTHRADLGRPLSASNYETWRQAIPHNAEEVVTAKLANGDEAMILKASGPGPFLPNAIVSAELTVRQTDWYPVEQRLQMQGEGEIVDYALGQVGFDVIALNVLPPSIFSTLLPPSSSLAVLDAPPLPALPVLKDTRVLPGETELLAAEVEAWYALHSVGVCLGRPILVARTGLSQIEVEGVVETDETKIQVLAALRGIPYIAAKIRTVAEDSPVTYKESRSEENWRFSDSTEPRNRTLAIQDLLKEYFMGRSCGNHHERTDACVQQKIAQLSQAILSSSEAALSQAWALRQLAQCYPSSRGAELRTATRRLLELMVQDHMNTLKSDLHKSQALVLPVLSSLLNREDVTYANRDTPLNSPLPVESDWARAAISICSSVERTLDLALGMFVETNLPVANRNQAMKDLLSGFFGLEQEVAKLEQDVARDLSETPRVLTSNGWPEQK